VASASALFSLIPRKATDYQFNLNGFSYYNCLIEMTARWAPETEWQTNTDATQFAGIFRPV
jgi:hypothetical protein